MRNGEVEARGPSDHEADPEDHALAWVTEQEWRDRAQSFFGPAFDLVDRFAGMLSEQGEVLGLIGPRETGRLWSRHMLNSAVVGGFLPGEATVADLGSGAGLPGIVAAAMRPDLSFDLIEPMERRVTWLRHVIEELGLKQVHVTRARAEELDGAREADAVLVRAVAPLRKLAPLASGLLADAGTLIALKGQRAPEEVNAATKALRKARLTNVQVEEVQLLPGLPATWVVTATKH